MGEFKNYTYVCNPDVDDLEQRTLPNLRLASRMPSTCLFPCSTLLGICPDLSAL